MTNSTQQSSGMFFKSGTHDIYIPHVWRYDAAWVDFVAMLDGLLGTRWRNWSLPWHDPSITRFTEEGRVELEGIVRNQIKHSAYVFLLADLCDCGENRQGWLEFQLNAAQEYDKKIIGLRSVKDDSFPELFKEKVDPIVSLTEQNISKILSDSQSSAA